MKTLLQLGSKGPLQKFRQKLVQMLKWPQRNKLGFKLKVFENLSQKGIIFYSEKILRGSTAIQKRPKFGDFCQILAF